MYLCQQSNGDTLGKMGFLLYKKVYFNLKIIQFDNLKMKNEFFFHFQIISFSNLQINLLIHRIPQFLHLLIGNVIIIIHLLINHPVGCNFDYAITNGFNKLMVVR